jgi:hypothetical protein
VIVGFTGSQRGMSRAQNEKFQQLISGIRPIEFHHGDCVGADATAHDLVQWLARATIIHPPLDGKKRAFKSPMGWSGLQGKVLPPKEYLERNRDIVDACDLLIATPTNYSDRTSPRSGTWYTIRYAIKWNKPVWIIYPGGNVEKRGGESLMLRV